MAHQFVSIVDGHPVEAAFIAYLIVLIAIYIAVEWVAGFSAADKIVGWSLGLPLVVSYKVTMGVIHVLDWPRRYRARRLFREHFGAEADRRAIEIRLEVLAESVVRSRDTSVRKHNKNCFRQALWAANKVSGSHFEKSAFPEVYAKR